MEWKKCKNLEKNLFNLEEKINFVNFVKGEKR